MLGRFLPAAAVGLSATAVLLAAGAPGATSGNGDGGVVVTAAYLAWALVGWLGVAIVVTATERAPGHAGRLARGTARVLVPRAMRVVAETVLGVAVVAAPLAAPAAAAHREWPDLDRATAPQHRPHAASVIVAPGDCLWRIVARDLAREGHPDADSAVDGEWPRWYAANRAVIGADPDLIQPGQRLVRPSGPSQ